MATTTWSWSCSDCQRAETGFQTEQGARSAANGHKRQYPDHHPIVGQEIASESKRGKSGTRAPAIQPFPSVEERLAALKMPRGTRDVDPGENGGNGGLRNCTFELEVNRAALDRMSDEEVYDFLQNDGCDVLMTSYLNARSVTLPRSGDASIECKADSKGNVECKGSVSIRF